MTKDIKQIQEENRKLILEAVHGCDYEEALEKELGLGCIICRYNIGMWGHLATKLYYKLDSFRINKNTREHDFIFINYGFQNLGEAWVGEDIDYLIIEKEKLIKELNYKAPEYEGRVQTKIKGKPLTLDRVLLALQSHHEEILAETSTPCTSCFGILLESLVKYTEEQDIDIICNWDLTKQTLEEQTEESQRTINELLTKERSWYV